MQIETNGKKKMVILNVRKIELPGSVGSVKMMKLTWKKNVNNPAFTLQQICRFCDSKHIMFDVRFSDVQFSVFRISDRTYELEGIEFPTQDEPY